MMRIVLVAGARPNFMKVAPVKQALARYDGEVDQLLVHTGQHYDARMSSLFFRDLGMPEPDVNLGVGSGSHAVQTATIMTGFEPVLREYRPDLVVVVGDVNSTLACALTACKLGVKVAHVEAGLRSFDRTMPEEINRICTDAIADMLFTTDRQADENLIREGVPAGRIHLVGNVMIDSLLRHRETATALGYHEQLGLRAGGYGVVTLHRPSNVDDGDRLHGILRALLEIAEELPIVFPVHPRTLSRIEAVGLGGVFSEHRKCGGLRLVEPLGYLEFLSLTAHARMVLTDSGGLQEETTILGIPCVTLRDNTERPVTISQGTNRLAGTRRSSIIEAARQALHQPAAAKAAPEKWDGRAAERIADILVAALGGQARQPNRDSLVLQ
jgi:UDP-N-acetylglucosamine 2-epimerase (non-hydrolysing)